MDSGIYKITNIINGKMYIGLTKNLKRRFNWHKYHLRKNKHENCHLQHAWNKYGENSFSFSILEECEQEKLSEREKYWINFFGGYESPNLYNMKDGGEKGNAHTKEVKEKISQANKGKSCVWKGKHLPEETKEKIKNAQKGRKLTPQRRERAIATLRKYWQDKHGYWLGKTMSEEHRQKLRESHKGQKSWNKGNKGMISDETRQKLINSHLGHKHNEETRKKMSISRKGKSRLWVNKNGKISTIKPEQLEEYLSLGWKRGQK